MCDACYRHARKGEVEGDVTNVALCSARTTLPLGDVFTETPALTFSYMSVIYIKQIPDLEQS